MEPREGLDAANGFVQRLRTHPWPALLTLAVALVLVGLFTFFHGVGDGAAAALFKPHLDEGSPPSNSKADEGGAESGHRPEPLGNPPTGPDAAPPADPLEVWVGNETGNPAFTFARFTQAIADAQSAEAVAREVLAVASLLPDPDMDKRSGQALARIQGVHVGAFRCSVTLRASQYPPQIAKTPDLWVLQCTEASTGCQVQLQGGSFLRNHTPGTSIAVSGAIGGVGLHALTLTDVRFDP